MVNMQMGSIGKGSTKVPEGPVASGGQSVGALVKPAMDTAQKAAKAGKIKSLKIKMKMK